MERILAFALTLTVVFAGYKELREKHDRLEKMMEFVDFCSKNVSINPEILDAILDPTTAFPKDDENAKCFLRCVQEKRNFVNEKGEVQQLSKVEGEEDKMGDLVRELLEKCQEIVVATCDDALKLENCMSRALREKLKKTK